MGHVRARGAQSVQRAVQAKAAGSDIGAVKHVVFLMQENRSFDHYFGTMGGVQGFDDTRNRGSFTQNWPTGSSPTLLPFHMDTKKEQAECTYDLSHSWQAEHSSWNNGAMDSFVSIHTSSQYEGDLGINTMGYYKKGDLPFYYDLAKHFTVCDNYFCSVLGPTHPNRLMQMTGTLDPAGVAGGPILVTNSDQTANKGTCSWQTMPEVLQANNITWKCYNPHGSSYQPGASFFVSKNVLLYFQQYLADPSSSLYKNAFEFYGPAVTGGLTDNTSPNDFANDVMNNTLPQVSWIMSPDSYDEHPPAPAALGEWYTQQILDALTSNPAVWASTVLIIMYDENDGFFDHVPPPTPPIGTAGEYLTVSPLPSDAGGIAGPIGMGVRVPAIVVSPFSAGGYVCHDTFDHTSQLRLLETLFGVSAPNISSWRRDVTGDLTSALPVLGAPVTKVPTLPATSPSTTAPPVGGECSTTQILELNPSTAPLAIKRHQKIPNQSRGTLKPTPA
ncbi:MAG TPA: alkaline phosphatase family protein [Acidimicrobiales bacterium]|nr:alkaline phosphatase family protein [Acidimicrobiales bacterium]